ncbi:DUF305 domain-containing protein [Catellatospora sp. NPDC049609]|uniref:DUF305 domain-containing protein n=1 Tax=Catellatospora sp. NPDC049609 TaxID=3155505 RepID=UPI003439E58F
MIGRPSLRPALLAVAAAAVLAVTACTDHGEHAPDPSVTASSPVGVYNGADTAFAQSMIVHHQQALDMTALAAQRQAGPEVAALAAQIRRAQEPEIATMRRWLAAWQQPTAAPAHDKHAGTGMLTPAQFDQLRKASGAEFDRLFCELMIMHHEGAVAMAEKVQADGASTQVEVLATRIIADQRAEIAKMRALLKG